MPPAATSHHGDQDEPDRFAVAAVVFGFDCRSAAGRGVACRGVGRNPARFGSRCPKPTAERCSATSRRSALRPNSPAPGPRPGRGGPKSAGPTRKSRKQLPPKPPSETRPRGRSIWPAWRPGRIRSRSARARSGPTATLAFHILQRPGRLDFFPVVGAVLAGAFGQGVEGRSRADRRSDAPRHDRQHPRARLHRPGGQHAPAAAEEAADPGLRPVPRDDRHATRSAGSSFRPRSAADAVRLLARVRQAGSRRTPKRPWRRSEAFRGSTTCSPIRTSRFTGGRNRSATTTRSRPSSRSDTATTCRRPGLDPRRSAKSGST